MFYSSVDELEKDIAGVVDFALYQVQSAHTLLAHPDLFPIVGSNSALTHVHTLIQTGSNDLQACSSELNTSSGEEVQCRGTSHQVCVQPRLREVHDRDSGVGQLNGPSKPAKDNFPCVLNVSHLATFPVIFYVS